MAEIVVYKDNLKDRSPFEFKSGDKICIATGQNEEIKYVIELKKEEYPHTFKIESRVKDAKTGKYLSCSVGSKEGMRPKFIDDFIKKEN